MRQIRAALTLGVIAIFFVLLIWFLLIPIPTTPELDADLEKIHSKINDASDQNTKYDQSLIKALISIREEILKTTEAMLLQKKLSVMRRICLDYRIDGHQLNPASDETLDNIKEEITQAEQKLSISIQNAQRYSGGLVQGLALMNVETDRLSVSQLWLKFYSAKYGLPFFWSEMGATTKQPEPEPGPGPGRIVKDRDAL